MTPGTHLTALLRDRGLSEYRLAVACGLPRQVINGIVRNRTRLTAGMALLIAKALSVSENDLLDLQRTVDKAKARRTMRGRLEKVERLTTEKAA